MFQNKEVISYKNDDNKWSIAFIENFGEIEKLQDVKKEVLLKAIKDRTEELREHFEEDGWDIDCGMLLEGIFYDAFGFHISEAIYGFMNESLGVYTEYTIGKGTKLVKPRTFVYYDEKNDKITTSKKLKKKLIQIGIL